MRSHGNGSRRTVYPKAILSKKERLVRGTNIGMQQQVQVNRLKQYCFLHDSIKPVTHGETGQTDLKVNFQHASLLFLCNTTCSLSPLITGSRARGQAEPARLFYESA